MNHSRRLRVLFPTSFSAACRQTGQAIAQLAEGCRLDLTIVHAVEAGHSVVKARWELESFLPQADGYDSCRRILAQGVTPTEAVAELCADHHYDLVMAPASEPDGLSTFLRRPFRAGLLQRCPVPLWTAGPWLRDGSFHQPVRTIACLIDFDGRDGSTFLPLVTAFAARFKARVRVVHVLPQADEALLTHVLSSEAPLRPETVRERACELFAAHAFHDVDAAAGTSLRTLLQRTAADLLFVGPGHAGNGRWFLRYLDRLPCPVVSINAAAAHVTRWSFQESAHQIAVGSALAAPREEIAS